MLKVTGLHAGYGDIPALFGVDLEVRSGEVVTLLGRNGMGKTTTVSTIMGLIVPTAGVIEFEDKAINGLPAFRVAQRGIGLVPEGRQIFPNLTVRENLLAIAANRSEHARPWTLSRVMAMFPILASRADHLGALLSGGEQQMLALGRALMTNPKLLILDEATEGLAPLIRAEIWRSLAGLKALGQSILVIDKNINALCNIADRHYILEKGFVVWHGDSISLRADALLRQRFLGV